MFTTYRKFNKLIQSLQPLATPCKSLIEDSVLSSIEQQQLAEMDELNTPLSNPYNIKLTSYDESLPPILSSNILVHNTLSTSFSQHPLIETNTHKDCVKMGLNILKPWLDLPSRQRKPLFFVLDHDYTKESRTFQTLKPKDQVKYLLLKQMSNSFFNKHAKIILGEISPGDDEKPSIVIGDILSDDKGFLNANAIIMSENWFIHDVSEYLIEYNEYNEYDPDCNYNRTILGLCPYEKYVTLFGDMEECIALAQQDLDYYLKKLVKYEREKEVRTIMRRIFTLTPTDTTALEKYLRLCYPLFLSAIPFTRKCKWFQIAESMPICSSYFEIMEPILLDLTKNIHNWTPILDFIYVLYERIRDHPHLLCNFETSIQKSLYQDNGYFRKDDTKKVLCLLEWFSWPNEKYNALKFMIDFYALWLTPSLFSVNDQTIIEPLITFLIEIWNYVAKDPVKMKKITHFWPYVVMRLVKYLNTLPIELLSVDETFNMNIKLLQEYMKEYECYFPNETPSCKKRAYPDEQDLLPAKRSNTNIPSLSFIPEI